MTISVPHPRLRHTPSLLDRYMILVILAGLAVFVSLLPSAAAALGNADLTFWVLAACALPAEIMRVTTRSHGGGNTLTMSRPFVLALFTGWGAPLTIVVFVIASVISDLIYRKPALRIPFNAGQYALSITAASAVYTALGGGPSLRLEQTPAFIAATVVLVLLNRLLVRVAVALYEQHPLSVGYVVTDAQVELVETAMQSTVVLVALLIADHRLVLPLLLALPALPILVAGRAVDRAQKLSRQYAEQVLRYRHLFVVADRFRRQADTDSGVNRVQLGALSLDLRASTAMLRSLLGTIASEAERHGLDVVTALAGNSVEHTQVLASKLEQLQHTQAAAHSPTRQRIDAADLVRIAEQLATTICKDRPVLIQAPPQGLPILVNQDEVLDVLSNLIRNADRFAAPQTPLRLIADRQASRVVLAVEDDGAQVSPEQRERLFHEGPPAHGLGHGLAMARQLAHANGAELRTVDPEEANGRARFELRLPLAEQPSPSSVPSLSHRTLGA